MREVTTKHDATDMEVLLAYMKYGYIFEGYISTIGDIVLAISVIRKADKYGTLRYRVY